MLEIKKILCAVDFSESSDHVLEYATMLAKSSGAKVEVLYVTPSLGHYSGFDLTMASIQDFESQISAGAEASMKKLVEGFEGVQATGHVKTGYPAEEILDFAEEDNIDLIVMGTHGRTGIDRILFGSVAEKVVKHAKVPVLTVRPNKK